MRFFEYAMPYPLLSLEFHFPAIGLHFLRANVPGIRMLEYPSWQRFCQELEQRVDVLGISFYTRDIPVVEEMVRLARERYGVGEVWGGNYGVLTPGMDELFDRVFVGYSENALCQALHGTERQGELRHPLMIAPVTAPLFPPLRAYMGIMLTHRGCNLRCTFCQTPQFAPKMTAIDKKELERVVDEYYRLGVRVILFAEESFMPSLNRELLDRIAYYGMKWYSESHVKSLSNRIEELVRKTGYAGSIVGIESISERNLEFIDKRLSVTSLMDTLEEARQAGVFMQGTYMFGYEEDTPESLAEDAERLLELPLLVNHYFVLTPYPRTHIASYIENRYGPASRQWSFYDSRHLLWNHPHFTPREIEAFVDRMRARGWGLGNYIKMGLKTLRLFGKQIRVA